MRKIPADLQTPSVRLPRRRRLWAERFLIGAMLALASFSLEAGLGQIALARDAACRAEASTQRVGPPGGTGCLSDFLVAGIQSLARGPAGALNREAPILLAWASSAFVYALLGGVCAQLTAGWAVGTYLSVHSFMLAAVAFLSYIAPYVTL